MEDIVHQTEKQTIYWEGYYEGQKENKEKIERLSKEVEQLKKERRWLINTCGEYLYGMIKVVNWEIGDKAISREEVKNKTIKKMTKALKEE